MFDYSFRSRPILRPIKRSLVLDTDLATAKNAFCTRYSNCAKLHARVAAAALYSSTAE